MRKTFLLIAVLFVFCFSLKDILAQKKVDLEKEKAELLKMHQISRKAHFETNAEMLLQDQGKDFISVSDGKIKKPKLEESKTFFKAYFKDVKYFAWDNLEPPIIQVSKDATMAWVIVRVKVHRIQKQPTGADREISFIYAGIETYEKQKGKWVKTANVSTFE